MALHKELFVDTPCRVTITDFVVNVAPFSGKIRPCLNDIFILTIF